VLLSLPALVLVQLSGEFTLTSTLASYSSRSQSSHRILCIVHLVFFILACMRSPTTATTNNAELGQVKAQEAYPQQQPYPQQPVHNQGPYPEQPNYGGQPQYQQAHPTQ
jgi:hypothetical protein